MSDQEIPEGTVTVLFTDLVESTRLNLHTGEVLSEDGDIHGETVIIAKRIEGLAPSARAVRHRCRGSRNSARRPSCTPSAGS
jgi:class 3 adenylate cyclase